MRLNSLLRCMLLSTVVFALVACKDETAEIGRPAPAVAAFDLQGNQVDLHLGQGKSLLLTFWSETCGVCIAELKELEGLAQAYPDKIRLVAVNIDGENADTRAVVQKHRLQLPVIKDQLNITAERYRLIGTPTSFVIDPAGNLQVKFEGLIPERDLHRLFTQN